MQDSELDKHTIKVLLSDTRILIIRLLKERKMMATELVSVIGIKKNSICKHLKMLAKAGYVERVKDNKHKWVYYQLTEKGMAMVASRQHYFDIIM